MVESSWPGNLGLGCSGELRVYYYCLYLQMHPQPPPLLKGVGVSPLSELTSNVLFGILNMALITHPG